MDVSIVIPAYNEQDNIKDLYSGIVKAMKGHGSYEIIFVDDGSTDSTYNEMESLAAKDRHVKVIKFRKNFGQTASWNAGFDNAQGRHVVTLDADLQNDPSDIPKLLQMLEEYDFVSGWRYKRKDPFTKRLFSGLSRFMRRKLIGDPIHDSGCSLKAYRRECLEGLQLHGEMHRYIAELLALQGFKAGELKVNHLPRKKGKTKYSLQRLPKGFLDLIVVAFWQKYSARPVHLFGGMGIFMSLMGFIAGAYLIYIKFMFHASIANRPLLMLAILLLVLGLQFLIFGLIADILVKLYYSDGRKTYRVERILNENIDA